MAEALAGPGTHIIAIARTSGALEELDERILRQGGTASLAALDISDTDALRQTCRTVYERWGRLDMLVHAAIHTPPLSPVAHSDQKDLGLAMSVNVKATHELIVCTDPLLKQSEHPVAVFFADACVGRGFHGIYGSSKAAQIALARSWQRETGRIGPKVYIFSPSPMQTASRARFFPGEDPSALAKPDDEAARMVAELKQDLRR